VTVSVKVEADAGEAEIRDLIAHTDRVAEISQLAEVGTPVTLMGVQLSRFGSEDSNAQETQNMKVGFIGLGIMGSRMAANLKRRATTWSFSTGRRTRRRPW